MVSGFAWGRNGEFCVAVGSVPGLLAYWLIVCWHDEANFVLKVPIDLPCRLVSASRSRFFNVLPKTSSTPTVWTLPPVWKAPTVVCDWLTSPRSPCPLMPIRQTASLAPSILCLEKRTSVTARPTSAGSP